MDASEKIIQFETYDALIDEIKRDMTDGETTRCRYPVRYIMLNNFDVFTKLAQELAHLGVQSLNLESIIEDEHDRWITTDELCKAVKSCRVNTLVTPFSELVRFYKDSDFRGFFNEIMIADDMDLPMRRIYIPLIGLQNRFSDFLNSFARIDESAPVWAYLTDEHKTKVYLTDIKNDAIAFAKEDKIINLPTLYDWLRFWKDQAPQTQIICSSRPVRNREKYSNPDNIFTFEHIKNAYQYIVAFLGIDIDFAYDEAEENYWKMLLSDILKEGPAAFSFSAFVSSRLNLQEVKPGDLLFRWVQSETTDYDHWLIKNFFLSSTAADKYPYLKICFEEIKQYSGYNELPSRIADRIFYFSEPSIQRQYAPEREWLFKNSMNIIHEFTDNGTVDYIKGRITEIDQNDTQLAIELTTGIFEFERILLTAWYADRENTGLTINKVAPKYPDLGMYLSEQYPSFSKDDTWYLEYLTAYREAKLKDELSDDIKSVISTKNHDEDSFYAWYHSFEESHNRLSQHISSDSLHPDKIYWIDALGAEFLPFLLALIEQNNLGYRVAYSEVTRCTIPSATAQNRFESVRIGDLDAIAHDSAGYKKNATLVRELDVLQRKILEIIFSNSHGEHTIAIVSDHGLSCLSRFAESKKYDAKVEHDGRYIKVSADGKLYHDSDYVVHVNEKDGERYKVALTHSSLGRKPVHEVHGGCTPEEVLVPYIIITNNKKDLTQYKYELITKEIEVTTPTITVNVMPQPKAIKLHIKDKEYDMTRSGSRWSAVVDGLCEGDYKAEFTIPGGTSFNEIIKIIGTGFGGNNFLDF